MGELHHTSRLHRERPQAAQYMTHVHQNTLRPSFATDSASCPVRRLSNPGEGSTAAKVVLDHQVASAVDFSEAGGCELAGCWRAEEMAKAARSVQTLCFGLK